MALITPGGLLSTAQAAIQFTAKDVVGIYDQDFNQLFNSFVLDDRIANPFLAGARPRSAEVILSSKLMSHPLENGAMIVDHRVVNLIEIRIPMLVSLPTGVDMVLGNTSIFNEIKKYYDNSSLLIVQTKSGVYKNMVIEEMPEIETSEFFDTLQVEIRFKQAPYVKSKYVVDSRTPKYSNPASRGDISYNNLSQPASSQIIGGTLNNSQLQNLKNAASVLNQRGAGIRAG